VFGSGLDATEENVRAGLAAYIANLRNQNRDSAHHLKIRDPLR